MLDFAALRDAALARHIADEVAFPSSMVDRIVPATTDGDRSRISEALGLDDAWPVMTEPFCQWVIEDRFPDRPAGLGKIRRHHGAPTSGRSRR